MVGGFFLEVAGWRGLGFGGEGTGQGVFVKGFGFLLGWRLPEYCIRSVPQYTYRTILTKTTIPTRQSILSPIPLYNLPLPMIFCLPHRKHIH